MAVKIQVEVFWVMTPFGVVVVYQGFSRATYLNLKP